MSFAGILGAGLLGGAANAAKGIGDRIRAEAKQKREFALQDRADKKAQGLADTANDRAVEAAKLERIARAQRDRINNAALINRLDKAGHIASDAATVADGRSVTKTKTATGVAADVATVADGRSVTKTKTATGVAADVALTKSEVNIAAAKQLAIVNTERAEKLGIVQMEQLNANNDAALERIAAGRVGDAHTFYDADKGLKYVAIRQEDGSWKTEGGTEAPSASANSYTLQTIKLEGKEVSGFMDGKNWVTVGGAVKNDSEGDFDSRQATDYFTKQAWIHAGIKTGKNGFPEVVSEEDSALVAGWVDGAMKEWQSGGKKQPSSIVNSIFFKPLNRNKIEVNSEDMDEARALNVSNGLDEENNLGEVSKNIAMERYRNIIKSAQQKVDDGQNFTELAALLRANGIDPRFIKPK